MGIGSQLPNRFYSIASRYIHLGRIQRARHPMNAFGTTCCHPRPSPPSVPAPQTTPSCPPPAATTTTCSAHCPGWSAAARPAPCAAARWGWPTCWDEGRRNRPWRTCSGEAGELGLGGHAPVSLAKWAWPTRLGEAGGGRHGFAAPTPAIYLKALCANFGQAFLAPGSAASQACLGASARACNIPVLLAWRSWQEPPGLPGAVHFMRGVPSGVELRCRMP